MKMEQVKRIVDKWIEKELRDCIESGGDFNIGLTASSFYWILTYAPSDHYRAVGGCAENGLIKIWTSCHNNINITISEVDGIVTFVGDSNFTNFSKESMIELYKLFLDELDMFSKSEDFSISAAEALSLAKPKQHEDFNSLMTTIYKEIRAAAKNGETNLYLQIPYWNMKKVLQELDNKGYNYYYLSSNSIFIEWDK